MTWRNLFGYIMYAMTWVVGYFMIFTDVLGSWGLCLFLVILLTPSISEKWMHKPSNQVQIGSDSEE